MICSAQLCLIQLDSAQLSLIQLRMCHKCCTNGSNTTNATNAAKVTNVKLNTSYIDSHFYYSIFNSKEYFTFWKNIFLCKRDIKAHVVRVIIKSKFNYFLQMFWNIHLVNSVTTPDKGWTSDDLFKPKDWCYILF